MTRHRPAQRLLKRLTAGALCWLLAGDSARLAAQQQPTYVVRINPEFARVDQEITLSCGAPPESARCTFETPTLVRGETGAQTTLIVSGDAPWSRGARTFRVVAASASQTRTATVGLTVQ